MNNLPGLILPDNNKQQNHGINLDWLNIILYNINLKITNLTSDKAGRNSSKLVAQVGMTRKGHDFVIILSK